MIRKSPLLPTIKKWFRKPYTNCLAATLVACSAITASAQSTYNPMKYWTFNGANAVADSMGGSSLNFTTYNSPYTIENNGQVGKFLTLGTTSSLVDAGTLSLTNAVTIEFLFKPGYYFNNSKIIARGDDAFAIKMEYAKITFATKHNTASGTLIDEFEIQLNEIGRKSYGYYVDNNWHHMVFRFDAATGTKQVWVDGQNPTGFSKTVATGTFPSGNVSVFMNHTINYVRYNGSLDEIALYNTAIPSALIYKHYLGVQSRTPYNFVNNYSSTIPAASSVTGSFDMTEFAPGHPSVSVSATDQIFSYPVPRYKTGHTLKPNVPLYGVEYLGGMLQPGTSYSQALSNSKQQQPDLINNFNQSILAVSNTAEYVYAADTTKFAGWFIKYANQNPSKHTTVFSYWPQLNPTAIGRASSQPYSTCNCLSNNHYLRNSSGQFLDAAGNVSASKLLSPAAPVDSLAYDGLTQKFYLQQIVNRLSRPINLIFENGESVPFINNPTALGKDPAVVTDKNNSGLDWYTYEGRRAKEKALAYRNQFMNIPQLATTNFAYFQVDGQPTWRFKYEEMRQASTPMNGQYYPTGDIYMRYPDNWRTWSSAWHGWQWVVESRKVELTAGDKLFSPPVAAGWDIDETKNVRPAQWLGMLKAFSMAGAEYFYPSFFSLTAPFQDPKNWAWQVVMPAYAQAVTSRYEDLLRNGYLMEGDVPNSYSNPTYNAYSFKSGDARKLVVVRKHNSLAKYAITGTLQPNSSMVGNAENSGVAQITLDGQVMKFTVRRQGSTYIYDKTNASAPVFYQLDGWHEASHPYNWTRDFNFEAELFDNTNSNVVIKTTVPAGTTAGDYTNYTSFIGFNAASDVTFNFMPRKNAPSTQYLWVRARSKNGASAGFSVSLNNGTANNFDCIRDTNWVWYRFNTSNVAVAYSGLTNINYALKITALNTNIEIDKIFLTSNSSAVNGNAVNACTSAQATIVANGPTSFCQGGNVTLTASSGSSYQWSNGSTSQSINVTSSGTYTVTVTTSGIGSTSSPVAVSVNSLPIAAISASGSTSLCSGGNVTLTASTGSSYIWSPGGQTSQSIVVSTAGTFNVRVTNSNGCSQLSSNTTVTVGSTPTATISANGPTSICQGGNVQLTANAGSSYLWSPGGQTSQSISVTTAGSYNVRVTQSGGCSATSSNTTVTVNSAPTATITPSGSLNLPSGGSVTLTASSGSSYLWSPGGQTSQSITVSTANSYTVRVSNASGCSTISSPANVTVGSSGTATISASGHTTFCQGGTVLLTASNGTSYLWSNGSTAKSITVSASGSYSVTVYNGSTPSVSAPLSIVVLPLPTVNISASGPLTFCSGASVTLMATANASYSWTPTGQTTKDIVVNASGTYNVTVTGTNGCTKTAIAQPVTVTSCGSTCAAPYGLVTNNYNSSSATISWVNPNSGQTEFNVKIKNMNTGYVYITGKVPYTTNQITVGAASGTNYRWWVRSWCGATNNSSYAGYLSFTTPSARVSDPALLNSEGITETYPDTEADTDPGMVIFLDENEVQLYPNPAATYASLSFKSPQDEKVTISILEPNGKVISKTVVDAVEGFNIHDLDLSQLAKGMYMVQILANGQSVVKRLAVQ